MTNPRDNFQQVYREARSLRGVVKNEFVTVGVVEAFVSDSGRVVVGHTGDYAGKPGFYAGCVSSGTVTKATKRYFVERSREYGRVPLPR